MTWVIVLFPVFLALIAGLCVTVGWFNGKSDGHAVGYAEGFSDGYNEGMAYANNCWTWALEGDEEA